MRSPRKPAVDPITQYVKLDIDGRTYKLAYDFNAIANAEQAAGCNLLHGMTATLFNTMTAAQLRGLLWAAMLRAQPKMTLADVGQLVRLDTIPEIVPKLSEVYVASVPKPKPNPPVAGSAAAKNT